MPASVNFTSIYSRSDGVVHWRACLDPDATHLEIDGSHCGMALNGKIFRAIAEQLAPVQLRSVAPASGGNGRRAGQRSRRRLSRPPATLRQWQAVVPLSVNVLPASGRSASRRRLPAA